VRRPGRPPYAATAAVLLGTILVSLAIPAARRAFGGNVAPLFAKWDPSVGLLVVVPVAMAIAAWWLIPGVLRAPPWAVVAGAVAFGWVFSLALAAQSGGVDAVTEPFRRPLDYAANAPLVTSLGPRAFLRLYPDLIASGRLSLHASTHPPGASLLAWALLRATGGSLFATSAIVALIGAAAAVPTYAISRAAWGEGVAVGAAVLFASVPGVILFSATSMDAVFMTVIALAMAALLAATRSDAWAAIGGVLATVSLAFTFAALALAPIALGFWLLAGRGWLAWARPIPARVLVRRAAVALVAAAAGALLLRAALGLDLVAVFRATLRAHLHDPSRARSGWYWAFGDVAAFAIAAGVAITALVWRSAGESWRARRPGLETILIVVIALTTASGVFKGEVDHIWLFLIPLAVAAAAPALTGFGERTGAGEPDDAAAARLRVAVAIGLGQAILMEVLLFTFW
jgi:hypothetical protein